MVVVLDMMVLLVCGNTSNNKYDGVVVVARMMVSLVCHNQPYCGANVVFW